ncbi:SubName: Full=Uncharacterized protein {ECO:0000313/EMBL:CCA73555.1} [Serendipita indica DSM 11827]|uniref:F-box domain-containing protein n=1 Tax=Serendipita indica (strain DSM 11827) TaxID=1109443 RepID=G4TQG2_SERID|nr:SubName: Full=Uncharacterized protein {ECO:0000313/EMBL:CCA73555.1} [Serendipita indica DSM 11827]CCA73555.1 hypothetical protein PIIN_07508 [Serendipita indica DSM 11827]
MTSSLSLDAVYRTPIEIWRRIFEFCLGPSLLEITASTLSECQAFLEDEVALLQRYVAVERQRGRIRLVCHSWRQLADSLGDRIVVSHLDEHEWPPYRSKNSAHYISYRHYTSYLHQSPLSTYRRGIGAREPAPVAKPIKITRDMPFASITTLAASTLDLSDIDRDTPPANVYFLGVGPQVDPHALAHPLFYNIQILDILTRYPFESRDAGVLRTLPNLRCLMLAMSHKSLVRDPGMTLSAWHFPKLALFSVFLWGSPFTLSEDLLQFVHNHSSTLEEIDFPPEEQSHFARNADWSRFTRLRAIKLSDLTSLTDALPNLSCRWTPSASTRLTNTSEIPPLTITIDVLRRTPSSNEMVTRLLAYRDVLPNLTLRLSLRWSEWLHNAQVLIKESRRRETLRLSDGLRQYQASTSEIFAIIDETPLRVIDFGGDSAICDAAKELRALVFEDGPRAPLHV